MSILKSQKEDEVKIVAGISEALLLPCAYVLEAAHVQRNMCRQRLW